MEARDHVVIAADGATSRCLAAGTLPDLIVTDLDGDMPDEVTANQAGSWVVIHAHGDNAAALRHWVPRLRGKVCGSTPGRPRPGLLNVGGFTDGDRAVFLAEAYGARRVLLSGFDFHRLRKGEGEVKRRKLRVAQHLIDAVARRGKLEVYRFTSRGVQPWRIPRARTTRPAAAHSRTGA